MKKSSLVMILALVGMVGCSSGKQVELPVLRHPVDGSPCSIQVWASTAGESYNCVNGKWINNNPSLIISADGGESVIHVEPRTGLEFCEDFQRAADDWNHAHPKDGVSYGCGNIHPVATNPISPGNAAVILPEKPAKKPKAKKLYAMTGDPMYSGSEWNFEQPSPPAPDKAAAPAEPMIIPDSGLISTTFTLSALPAWSATIGSDNNIEVTDPEHELKCYGGPVGNADFSDASTGFTITCVTKSVEKAK